MRNASLLVLLVAAAACDSGRATRPEGASIAVRVRDDVGAPVERAPVVVALSTAAPVSSETRGDGTAVIAVAGAGTYEVTVVPGARYVATADLTKSVVVAPDGAGSVEFTLYRSGNAEIPRPEAPGN